MTALGANTWSIPLELNNLEAQITEFTVQVTPIFENKFIQLAVSKVINNKFTVYSSNGSTKFYWHVYGKRQNIKVEPNKSDVVIKGNGPYKWI